MPDRCRVTRLLRVKRNCGVSSRIVTFAGMVKIAVMSRPLRIEFSGAYYHITSPGNRREDIFEDDVDRRMFLRTLAEVVKQFNWLCHAYCLMTDHYHLMVETQIGSPRAGTL